MAREQPAERSVCASVARGRTDACHQRAIAHTEDLLTPRARGEPEGAYLYSRRVGGSETNEPEAVHGLRGTVNESDTELIERMLREWNDGNVDALVEIFDPE